MEFENTAKPNETIINTIENWDDFDIKPELLRGIYAYGFENPSDIQKKAIIPVIHGNDVIAQAQSGSGKTGTFSISTLQIINTSIAETQAIILAPTHELVQQIYDVITKIGAMMDGLKIKTLVGGTSSQDDVYYFKENTPHVIVGTSGRVFDMFNRNVVNTNTIKLFVMDEADEMLSKGFKEQIYNIFQYFNANIQVALFSATLPDEILDVTKKFMRNPVEIIVKPEKISLECIAQYYIALANDNAKYEMLKNLFSIISVSQCIIYCNNIPRVSDLYKAMIDEGYSVCCIHSYMSKSEREDEFRQFRKGVYRVMISSNITARGIDIQQVSTVINFDIPQNIATYLHRIGRSGRWGRKGRAINFVTRYDIETIKKIENFYHININEFPMNSTANIA
jgi:translation initiation factor 4A